MAEVNDLILPIGADPKQFTKSIDEVKAALKSLEKEIKSKKFNAINEKDRENLEGYRRTLVELNNSLNDVNFDKLEKGSKGARTAVTSLNLVVQDLPFGFIAIQNNLPGLIQSFGQLSAASGGAVGALKAIGASLIGPAGLFLAFTAVTSAVTFAIQEYGSLKNAINVLFGANGAAVKAQNEFNKALLDGGGDAGVQIAKINILVKTIQSETSTQNERLAAYRELKKISPEVVSGIDEQNLATAKSIKLIGENAKAVIELTKLQVKQRGIQAALSKLEEERFAINGKFNKARQDEINLQKEIAVAEQKRESGLKISSRENQLLVKKDAFLQTAADRVQEFRDEVIKNTSAQDVWYKSLEQSVTATSQISSNLETLQNNLEAETKKANEAANANKKLSEARAEQLRFAGDIRSLRNQKFFIEPELELPKKLDLKKYLPLPKAIDKSYANSLVDLIFPDEIFQELRRKAKGLGDFTIPELDEFKDIITANIVNKDLVNKTKSTYDDVGEIITKTINDLKNKVAELQLEDAIIKGKTSIKSLEEAYSLAFGNIVKRNKEIRDSIQSFLFQPLENLFDALLKGENSWKDFGNAVIGVIKRIAAQLAALAITKTLANLIAPGLGSISTKALESFLNATPDFEFGANISGGGLGLTGQVVMVQRGTDLIGVINRTNATINRVG